MQPPPLPEQEFFTMKEASRLAQVPPHTLRYWESRFGGLRPARRSGGHRRYSRADMATIFKIKDLLWRRRMTVAGARKALSRPSGEAPRAADGVAAPALKLLREVGRELRLLADELSKHP
jgi:DNA-binding transcriptional MerR regulator